MWRGVGSWEQWHSDVIQTIKFAIAGKAGRRADDGRGGGFTSLQPIQLLPNSEQGPLGIGIAHPLSKGTLLQHLCPLAVREVPVKERLLNFSTGLTHKFLNQEQVCLGGGGGHSGNNLEKVAREIVDASVKFETRSLALQQLVTQSTIPYAIGYCLVIIQCTVHLCCKCF